MSKKSRLFSSLARLAPVSIGRKLVLLLLLSILLVLALVGFSLDLIVREYHKDRAHAEFTRAFRHVVMEMEERERNLTAAVSGIAEDEQVVSTMSMIHRYARPKAYDPALFDAEKQKLTGILRDQVLARHLGQMSVYDGRGTLTAFFNRDVGEVPGIISYDRKGRPIVLTQVPDDTWKRSKAAAKGFLLNQRLSSKSLVRWYRFGSGFAMEVVRQVQRTSPNKRSERIGQVRGSDFLREDFVAAVKARSDVEFALVFSDGEVIGNIEGLEAQALVSAGVLDKTKPDAHTEIEHPDYFLAAAKLPMDGNKHVYLVAGVEKAGVLAQVARSQELLLLVLALSALIIIPTGVFAARRVISERVDLLLAGAKALSNGELARRVAVTGRDELGSLARSFNDMADALERREERLRQAAAVFESTAEGVLITDSDRVVIAVNRAFTRITGYAAHEAVGSSPALLRPGHETDESFDAAWREVEVTGTWQGELWNQRKDGEIHPAWMAISAVTDEPGEIINYVIVFSDITVIRRSQDQLDYLAHHDPVTELPNRLLFATRLDHSMERARKTGGQVAVLFLDLDRFKYVNDTLGHPVGDMLLGRVAERLKRCLRATDTVARMGGDEFVVAIEEAVDQAQLSIIAQTLIENLAEPFEIDGKELHLGASIGISLFPQDGADVATLVKHADAAMYLAKADGRNTYRFFTTALGIEAKERFELEGALRRAQERNELELFYQPQVELKTGLVTGAEALVRWRHSLHGLVSPDRFIALAEETGLIIPMGEWVLRTACRQWVTWRDKGYPITRIAVNLSGVQIERGDLINTVSSVVKETGIPPASLELEVTESVIMRDPARAAVILDGLRGLGVELAIDDFGTGYSSLSYLKRFPLDNLKIDKSFVRGVPEDANDMAIIRAVIALAENLQLGVIAEGVETKAQQDFLKKQGCQTGQGYLFSRPLPEKEFEALLLAGKKFATGARGGTRKRASKKTRGEPTPESEM